MWVKRALWMILGLLVLPWLALPWQVMPWQAMAGEVDVVAVGVEAQDGGFFTFNVTLRHADEGWEHYADRWDVVSADGATVYGERVLYHPHVTEQPFTRSLSGVAVPAGVREVLVRGHDKVHRLGGTELRVALPGR